MVQTDNVAAGYTKNCLTLRRICGRNDLADLPGEEKRDAESAENQGWPRRNRNQLPLDEYPFGDLLQYFVGNFTEFLPVAGINQQQIEFIAAIAAGDIDGAIVDLLEAVHINEADGNLVGHVSGDEQGLIEQLQEGRPFGLVGQFIMGGEIPELFLKMFSLLDLLQQVGGPQLLPILERAAGQRHRSSRHSGHPSTCRC